MRNYQVNKPINILDVLYTEKCEFGGKNSDRVGPELLQFGATENVVPSEYKNLVLVDVDNPDDECRHRLTASLKCELGHVELDFGTEAGGSADDFPHKIKIGNANTDPPRALLRGESPPAVCAHARALKIRMFQINYIEKEKVICGLELNFMYRLQKFSDTRQGKFLMVLPVQSLIIVIDSKVGE